MRPNGFFGENFVNVSVFVNIYRYFKALENGDIWYVRFKIRVLKSQEFWKYLISMLGNGKDRSEVFLF